MHVSSSTLTLLLLLTLMWGCASADAPSGAGADDSGGVTSSAMDTGLQASDTSAQPDTDPQDTGAPDTGSADTDLEDTKVEDTAPEDTAPEDTDLADTSIEDTAPEDTAPDVPPNMPPVAVVVEPIVGFAGSPITLDGSGSSDPDGEIAEHRWFVGDGAPLLGESIAYTWEEPGTYTGTLRVTDDEGATDEITFEVTARDPDDGRPVAAIQLTPAVAIVGEEATLSAEGSSDPDGEIVAWAWTLEGDALAEPVEASEESWAWTLEEAGEVTVTLTVTDDEGLTDTASRSWRWGVAPEAVIAISAPPHLTGEAVTFDATDSDDPDGSIVSYQWDFGDGQTGRNVQAQHVYTVPGEVTATLTVTDGDGLTDTAEVTLEITRLNAPPVAEAGPDVFGDVGQAIRFNGLGSSDPDGSIVSYRWDFGDDAEAMGESPTHAYASAGSYTVTLTVTDDQGATATDTLTATVGSLNEAPIAEAGPDREVAAGEEVTLDGSGSADLDGAITSYVWDFGDGQSAVGATATHTWSDEGSYTVTLTVTDDQGAEGSDTATITVTQPNRPPIPSFSLNPNPAAPDQLITFDASATSDPDGDNVVSYQWDFGDGSPLQLGQLITHAYDAEGVYQATLTATDAHGAAASVGVIVTIACDGGCQSSYDGLWEVLPFDTRDTYGATCGAYDIEIGPSNCETTVTGSSIVFNCGEDVYRGTLTGTSFDVTLDYNPQYDPFCDALVWFDERITGVYSSDSRWSGQSYTRLMTDSFDPFCGTCATIEPYPFQKTSNRLE